MHPATSVLDRSKVRRSRSHVVVATLAVALAASARPAPAANWETPAAGPSTSGGPEVLFTFDDGPATKTTAQILDTLAAHDISAIFFMVAWRFDKGGEGAIAKHRAMLRRVLDEGHVVANHTMTHAQLCKGKPEVAEHEIVHARVVLEREAGLPVPWFRAPYGAYCNRLVQQVEDAGIRHVYWDIDPQEWKNNNAKATEKYVIGKLKKLTGRAVILMHDTKSATAKALPKILDWMATENAARAKAGKPTIKVVGATQWARELVGEDVIAEAHALADDALEALAAGLASALP